MKKNFIRLSVVVGAILLVGYYFYSKKEKVTNPIPSYADSVWVLDYVNIRNTLLNDYLFGSGESNYEYLNIKNYGLSIPNYVMAFGCTEKAPNTIFTSFDITDSTLFSSWTDSLVLNYNFVASNNSWENKNIIITCNKEKSLVVLCIGIQLTKENTLEVANDIFTTKNLMKPENSLFQEIYKSNNHGLVWFKKGETIDEESWLTLNIKDNEMSLEGDLFLNKEYQFPETSKWQLESDNSQASYYMNFGESNFWSKLASKIDKENFEKTTGFNSDSLLNYRPNSWSMFLHSPSITQDSSISYEYDENFNQVEVTKVTNQVSPNFSLFTNFETPGFFSYLVKDSIIKYVDETPVFTSFPFAKVIAKEQGNLLELNTKIYENPVSGAFDEFLVLESDFTKVDSTYLNYLSPKMDIVKRKKIVLVGTQKGDSTHIELKVNL